ncbi:MAG: class I SAM-dependent methyltransferase [Ignavibacteria bacterium]|nr:class I SAM-dependent methyltransferase [Ignavibacteria bacterium]
MQQFIIDFLPKDKNKKILDVGCGLCKHLSKIKELGYTNVKGIDVSDYAVEFGATLGLEVEKITSISDYAKNHKDEYDFVLMAHVLEHLDKNIVIETLSSIRDMLTSSGIFFIIVPNAQSNTGCYWAYEDFTHATLYTAGSLMYVTRSAGFKELEFVDMDSTRDLKPFRRFMKRVFLKIYIVNIKFWNRVTDSHFFVYSPMIFSFELKAVVRK